MSSLWIAFLGSLVRYVLVIGVTWLLSTGLINETLAARLLGEGVTQITLYLVLLFTFGWSQRNTFAWFRAVKVALFMPETTPPKLAVELAAVSIYKIAPLLPSAPIGTVAVVNE